MGDLTLKCLRQLQMNVFCVISGKTGLSVEQRKRLTIAVELVANPSIVFMDEPTSGANPRALKHDTPWLQNEDEGVKYGRGCAQDWMRVRRRS